MNIELSTANLRSLCRICLQQGELNVNQHYVPVPETLTTIQHEISVEEVMGIFGKWECTELQLICKSCLQELLHCYQYYAKLVEAKRRIQKLYNEALLLENDMHEEAVAETEMPFVAADPKPAFAKIDIQESDKLRTKTQQAKINKQSDCLDGQLQEAPEGAERVHEFIGSDIRTPPPSPPKQQQIVSKCKPTRKPKFILTGGVSKILTHFNNESMPSISTPTKRASTSAVNAQKRQRTSREIQGTEPILTSLENASLVVTKFIPGITEEVHFEVEGPATETSTTNELRTMEYKAVEIKANSLQQIMEKNDSAADSDGTERTELSSNAVYVCKYCPQAYSTAEYLISHVRKSHACSLCPLAFFQTSELREHIKQAHRQHICAICGKELSSHSNLRSHIKRMHGLKLPAQVALLDYRPAVEELVEELEPDENESLEHVKSPDNNYVLSIEYAR